MVFVATTPPLFPPRRRRAGPHWGFFLFVVVLTARHVYPIQGALDMGQDWLYSGWLLRFRRLHHRPFRWAAGLHWRALSCWAHAQDAFVDGKAIAMHGSSLPLATLGTFVLWFGWFGFNGASQLAMGSAADVTAISQIFANTNMAAAGGVIATYLLTLALGKGKANLGTVLNGALAGLVSITAEPLTPNIGEAILIGAVGGVIATFGAILLEKLYLDDVVGAIPVHLFAGIWGTMIVPLTNPETSFATQAMGVGAIGRVRLRSQFHRLPCPENHGGHPPEARRGNGGRRLHRAGPQRLSGVPAGKGESPGFSMTQSADRVGCTPPPGRLLSVCPGAELPSPTAISQTRPTPAGKPRKPAKKARPQKRQRLFQVTILDLTGSLARPERLASSGGGFQGARRDQSRATPFLNGRVRSGHQRTTGEIDMRHFNTPQPPRPPTLATLLGGFGIYTRLHALAFRPRRAVESRGQCGAGQ